MLAIPSLPERLSEDNMFTIMHRYGDGETDPPLTVLPALYEELDAPDVEHISVTVTHDSGWSLSAYAGGSLVFEHLDRGEERHMDNVGRDEVIRLWTLLINGDIEAVATAAWKTGYGS